MLDMVSCTAVLEALNDALAGATTTTTAEHEVVVRSRLCARSHSAGAQAEQRALFQYLYVEADRQQHKRNGNYAEAYTVLNGPGAATDEGRRSIAVAARLTARAGAVSLGLFTVRRAAAARATEEEGAAAYVAVGPATTNVRAALILHDDDLVFVLNVTALEGPGRAGA